MGFEPTPAERNGLAVHRLNHSATSSWEYAADRQNNRNKIAVTCPRHFPIILAIAASWTKTPLHIYEYAASSSLTRTHPG